MKKTCETCRFYDEKSSCCKYAIYSGDTVAPDCMFVERFKRGDYYLDYAFSARDLLNSPAVVALGRERHLKQHGFESSLYCGVHSIPLSDSCPVWIESSPRN